MGFLCDKMSELLGQQLKNNTVSAVNLSYTTHEHKMASHVHEILACSAATCQSINASMTQDMAQMFLKSGCAENRSHLFPTSTFFNGTQTSRMHVYWSHIQLAFEGEQTRTSLCVTNESSSPLQIFLRGQKCCISNITACFLKRGYTTQILQLQLPAFLSTLQNHRHAKGCLEVRCKHASFFNLIEVCVMHRKHGGNVMHRK